MVESICATCTVAANPCSFLYFFEYFAPLGFNFCSFPSYRAVWVLYHGFMFFQLFLAESELRNFWFNDECSPCLMDVLCPLSLSLSFFFVFYLSDFFHSDFFPTGIFHCFFLKLAAMCSFNKVIGLPKSASDFIDSPRHQIEWMSFFLLLLYSLPSLCFNFFLDNHGNVATLE